MFLPIRTDRPLRTTPYVNYVVILLNVIVFVLTMKEVAAAGQYMATNPVGWDALADMFPVIGYYLHPDSPKWYQFLSSVFLHADIWHLGGNMLLLYVFGNNVEDRLGHVGYAGFYLSAGIIACFGHALMETAPVLGASGAVMGVVGCFLALFPLTRITVIIFFLLIIPIELPSMFLILLWFAQDAFYYLSQFSGVAYLAHLAGMVFGFAIGMTLLLSRLLAREPYDMLTLFEHRRRRAQFRTMTQRGYHPWESGSTRGTPPPPESEAKTLTPEEQRLLEKRAAISRAILAHNMDRAGELYAELLDVDSSHVLSRQNQMDLANHYTSQGRYDLAARAYELLLNNYKAFSEREQIELMLALLYVRYLHRGQRARELLTAAMPRLRDDDQKAMAQSLLAQLDGA